MLGAYSVSKTTLIGLTKAVAQDVASDNIRVNCLAPGVVRTKFSSAVCSRFNIFSPLLNSLIEFNFQPYLHSHVMFHRLYYKVSGLISNQNFFPDIVMCVFYQVSSLFVFSQLKIQWFLKRWRNKLYLEGKINTVFSILVVCTIYL